MAGNMCCVFRPANACLCMVERGKKTFENDEKSIFIMCTRGSCKTHKKFVGQWLGLTPKSWLLIWNFVLFSTWTSCAWCKNNKILNEQPAFGCQPAFGSHSQSLTNKLFSSCVLHEPLMHMMKKILFSSFSNIFFFLDQCVSWSKYTTNMNIYQFSLHGRHLIQSKGSRWRNRLQEWRTSFSSRCR